MIFVDFLSGKRKLWQAWWLIYTIPRIVFSQILAFVPLNTSLTFVILGLLLFFEIFGAVSVWQCSDNCKSKGWGSVASTLIFLGPLLAIGELRGDNPNVSLNIFSKISLIVMALMFLCWFFDKNINKSIKLKKYLMPLLIGLTYLFSFVGGFLGQEDNAIDNQLMSVRKNLPIKLDSETELSGIDFKNNLVSYQYVLLNVNASDFDKQTVYSKMKKAITKRSCNSADTKPLLEKRINLSYDYSDKNSLPLFKILVTEKECEELRSE